MLLTITTTHEPATDLGYLLHKNPARAQSFELAFGRAHVVYPEVTATRCTAALILDVDPVGLVRGGRGTAVPESYVNDRPYVASSFLSVAIAQVYGSALAGRSRERPELVSSAIPLEATVAALPSHGGDAVVRRLFEPLGYHVSTLSHVLDPRFPAWGASRYLTVTLRATARLSDLLRHIYVLVPVLDGAKHYWVGDDEVDKLVAKGREWLGTHPERELIARRYLRHRWSLARAALARLTVDEQPDPEAGSDEQDDGDAGVETRMTLHEQRLGAVVAALRASGARRVLDLGCGEGRLLDLLLKDRDFDEILGMDVSIRSLEIAHDRLRLDRLAPRQRARIRLIHGSLLYRDARLAGYDAAAIVEVIEHLDAARVRSFERVLFEFARPATVVLTTPNREYNVRFTGLAAGALRHRDHRFEWTRAEFHAWASSIAERFGYTARFQPVGPEDEQVGAPSQMCVFTRTASGVRDEVERA
jgi:3' terminal RNA ribose 2'-O-methyltransferase Hen1